VTAEILINVTSREVRAAELQDGILQELLVERAAHTSLLGNVYKGKVSRVLPGMQAAFVEIGLQRTAFLHASDVAASDNRHDHPDIRELLREGDDVIVQILKEPIGNKGARLTTQITIPSRYLVMMPKRPGIGVSARIENPEERERLRSLAEDAAADSTAHGYIVRTAAEGATLDMITADVRFLSKLWDVLCRTAAELSGIGVVHADLPLAIRVIRDLSNKQIERVRVDSEECMASILEFVSNFMPEAPRIELYEGRRPIFDLYGLDDEITRALDRKVSLKSGGYLIIEQTEAMSTIDVNTGAYVGRSNLEDTIFRTNLEAAVAIARQLRLRNLGGIIILDFIDMQSEGHRNQVLEALEAAMLPDSARTQITHVSPLGLVEMTRKRTRESLEHILCESCPACNGRGHVKTAETVCYEILRELLRQHRQFPKSEFVVIAHDDVVEKLLDEEASILVEMEELTGRPVRLQAQAMSRQDAFDVVPV
jgi:ribonuclease G